MKKSTPMLVEIIITAVIALIVYNVASVTVFEEENPFNSGVQGFLVFFLVLLFFDMAWKLIKNLIGRISKK